MPTYEYACEACGNAWETEQRISEPALKDCPKCGEPKAKRLISGGNFMLKGGGWYADGYGNKKSTGGESKSADSSSSSSSSTPSSGGTSSGGSSSKD